MPEIVAGAGSTTFSNTFRCAPEIRKRSCSSTSTSPSAWHASFPASSVPPCTAQPGRHPRDHYLQWQTAADLSAMQRSAQFQEIARGFDGLIEFDPHEVEIVHIATQPSQHST
jgi:hypothetical protein